MWLADDPSAIVSATHRRFTSRPVQPAIFGFRAVGTFLDVLVSSDPIPLPGDEPSAGGLLAGDADQDLDFDQFDLVQVQMAAKYLTGRGGNLG